MAIRWNSAAQQHLRPVEDLARWAIDKLAGPPADFLNAAPIRLPANRTSPKASFSTQSADTDHWRCDDQPASIDADRIGWDDLKLLASNPELAISPLIRVRRERR